MAKNGKSIEMCDWRCQFSKSSGKSRGKNWIPAAPWVLTGGDHSPEAQQDYNNIQVRKLGDTQMRNKYSSHR